MNYPVHPPHGLFAFRFAALLSLSAPLFVGADTLYWGGGIADIPDGTALPSTSTGLAGTWDGTLQNWSSSRSPTDYRTWQDNSFLNLGYYTTGATTETSTISVSGNKSISGLFASFMAQGASNNYIYLTGATAGTKLSLTGATTDFIISSSSNTRGIGFSNSNLTLGSGSSQIVKDGGGNLQFNNGNNSDFTGSVLIKSGLVGISSGTNLSGVTRFDLVSYRPSLSSTNATGNQEITGPTLQISLANTAGTSNTINDTANITLSRGTLDLRGGGGNKPTEYLGGLILEGAGFISNDQGSTATGGGANWVFSSLSRGTNGTGTLLINTTSGDVLQHNIQIANAGSIPTDVLLPWISTGRGEWLMIDSSNNNTLTRIVSTAAATDLSTWDTTYTSASNLRAGTAVFTSALDNDLTINSLGFLGPSAASTMDLGGHTLTLASGALGFTIGGTTGVTITNGNITSNYTNAVTGRKELYISQSKSNGNAPGTIQAALTGTMDVYYTASATLTFNGSLANTYDGTFYVNSGTVIANKANVVTGDLVLASGSSFSMGNAAAIASTSNITIASGANLSSGSLTPSLTGTVTLNGGQWLLANNGTSGVVLNKTGTGLAFNGGRIVHNSGSSGAISLLSNVSYSASSNQQSLFQKIGTGSFTVNLNTGANAGNAERTFDIADSSTLSSGVAEMLIDTVIANGGSGTTTGGIRKTGTGVLQLAGTNTYSGGTVIDGGVVQVSRLQADARTGLSATFGGISVEGDVLTFLDPIARSVVIGQAVTGTGVNSGRVVTAILNDYQVVLNGTVGSTAQAQSDIALGAVDRMGTLGTGAATVNNTGTLLVDSGVTVNNTVTVNSGGTFRNNGIYGGSLTMASGGTLAGSGTFGTAVNMVSGSTLAPGNSPGLATFSNGLTLETGSNFTFELAGNTAAGRGTSFDAVDVTGGTFTLQSGVNFNITLNASGSSVDFTDSFWSSNQSWLVFDNATNPSIAALFALGTITTDSNGVSYSAYGSFSTSQIGNDIYLTWTAGAIPEPSALATLAGLGALGLAAIRRRKR